MKYNVSVILFISLNILNLEGCQIPEDLERRTSYTPDIRSMWGYIVFAFPFVSTFVCSFVRSSFRHRVKVFALKFIRRHILKTL